MSKLAAKSLRRAGDLVAAGLAPAERLAELGAGSGALRGVADVRGGGTDRSGRSERSDRAPVRAGSRPSSTRSRRNAADPIGDDAHSPVEGIVHRYPDRVLLKLVHVCPVYCRFCFRREMVGPRPPAARCRARRSRRRSTTSARIEEIWEVILTGGDPLIAVAAPAARGDAGARRRSSTSRSCACTPACRWSIPGGSRPRWSRALKARGKATYVVLHANHARELTARARAACARFVDAGIPMLSQSVLLRGVNDDADDARRPDARPWSNAGSSPTTCIMATSRPAPRICAPRSRKGRR